MKKIDITLKISNLNQWEAERFYRRLLAGENPIHPTISQHLTEQIVKKLGYTPEKLDENTI